MGVARGGGGSWGACELSIFRGENSMTILFDPV